MPRALKIILFILCLIIFVTLLVIQIKSCVQTAKAEEYNIASANSFNSARRLGDKFVFITVVNRPQPIEGVITYSLEDVITGYFYNYAYINCTQYPTSWEMLNVSLTESSYIEGIVQYNAVPNNEEINEETVLSSSNTAIAMFQNKQYIGDKTAYFMLINYRKNNQDIYTKLYNATDIEAGKLEFTDNADTEVYNVTYLYTRDIQGQFYQPSKWTQINNTLWTIKDGMNYSGLNSNWNSIFNEFPSVGFPIGFVIYWGYENDTGDFINISQTAILNTNYTATAQGRNPPTPISQGTTEIEIPKDATITTFRAYPITDFQPDSPTLLKTEIENKLTETITNRISQQYYWKGYDDAILQYGTGGDNIAPSFFTNLARILEINIFPNFTIGTLLTFVVGMAILTFIIKFIRG